QYFTETYESNKIHLSFSSLYGLKYTKTAFVYQLAWLLTNRDLRQVYESLAFTWLQTNTLKFEWDFVQPINITARVKENNNTRTVLQIVSINNKHIPYRRISITQPEKQNCIWKYFNITPRNTKCRKVQRSEKIYILFIK